MAVLNITIKGIALIHHDVSNGKDDIVKIYLPFDDKHRVKLKFHETGPGIALADAHQKITIGVDPPTAPISDDNSFKTFFDVTEERAHKNGVRLLEGYEKKTVVMEIQGGVYSAKISDCPYKLAGGPDNKTVGLGKLGTSGMIRVEGKEITFDVIGMDQIKFGEYGSIIIDNDCPKYSELHKLNNDFLMFYEQLFKDEKNDKIRFDISPDKISKTLPCNSFQVTKLLQPKGD